MAWQRAEEARFSCNLAFTDAWRASRPEMDALMNALIGSLDGDGVDDLVICGDILDGTFALEFDVPEAMQESSDSLAAMSLVVRALNSGRVAAPGWPDDQDIDDAIASVNVRACGLIPA